MPLRGAKARRGFAVRDAALRDIMQAADIATEQELARRMGVAPSTVSRVLRGEMGAGRLFVQGLGRAFPGVPITDLVDLS